MTTVTTFDRTTALRSDAHNPAAFHADLDPGWSSLRGIHGGYLAALAVRAAEAQLDGRAVRTLTMSFQRPAVVGRATLTAAVQREGRKLSTVTVTIAQEGTVAVARITAAAEREGVEWEHERDIDVAPFAECIPFDPPGGVNHFAHAQARLDPRGIPLERGDRECVRGYVRPVEARPIDAAWLAMVCDWFPPCAFVVHPPPTGGVSVDYTVHIHRTLPRLDEGEWLRGRFEAPVSRGGLALEHGVVLGPRGEAVAESFHSRFTG